MSTPGTKRRRGAPLVHEDEIRIGGEAVPFTVLRMPGRRHVHLMVGDEGGLEVRGPWRLGLPEARKLVREHAAWAVEAMEKARARRARRPRLISGAVLPLLDECLGLRVDVDAQLPLFSPPRARGRVRRRGSELRVLAPAPRQDVVRALVEEWYRGEARRRLPARARELATHLGVRPARISIRGQRTRWGSCSDSGTLSLNWRLLLVPSELADYILVHELCHLRHMDHSRAFWAMVGSLLPDYRARRARLDALQDSLAL